MNKGVRSPQHVLQVFDPHRKHKPHDEVDFAEGRYLDIATTKGKDPHTLYFGRSKASNLLSGIFLGDTELTSKVKDVSLSKTNGVVTLSVKYVDDKGKLATVKTTLPSSDLIGDLSNIKEAIDASLGEVFQELDIINSSVEELRAHDDELDASIADITEHLDIIDTSLSILNDELESGKYNYSIHCNIGDYTTGFKKTYTLFKGDEEQTDSSVIEITDMSLKELKYTGESNTIEAKIWPTDIKSIDKEGEIELPDGTMIPVTEASLSPDLIQTVSLEMDEYDEHVNEFMNTDSSVNDRLEIVETQLKWENIK